jgi:GAF domain-containing protein
MLDQKPLLLLIKEYKDRYIDDKQFYPLLTELLAAELECTRASLWLYKDAGLSEISAVDIFDSLKNQHSSGEILTEVMFNVYFQAMRRDGRIDASDARHHPATRCFNEAYFKPNNIFSLLDIGIYLNGHLVGVFCCEHVGEILEWNHGQKLYLEQAGKLITFALKPLLVQRFAELFP